MHKQIKKSFTKKVALPFEGAAWQFLDDELQAFELKLLDDEHHRIRDALIAMDKTEFTYKEIMMVVFDT